MGSILSGEDVTNAMDLRCFGMGPRTWVEKTVFQRRDYLLLVFSVLMIVASILLRYVFHVGAFWVPGWIIST